MKSAFVTTALGQVHCQITGEGPPVLLIHQSGRSSRMFRRVLPLLAGKVRAIALDLPGFGWSDPLPEGTSMAELADLCCEVLDQLDAAPALVYGHHSGNKIATEMAVRSPEKVSGLILAGQSHSIIPDQDERNAAIGKFTGPYSAIRGIKDPAMSSVASWSKVYRAVSEAWWRPVTLLSDDQRDQSRAEALDAIESEVGAARLYAANTAYDLGGGYQAITQPTTVLEIVTEEEDALIGRRGKDVCALIPISKLAEIQTPDGDGVTLEAHADELADIILSSAASETA